MRGNIGLIYLPLPGGHEDTFLCHFATLVCHHAIHHLNKMREDWHLATFVKRLFLHCCGSFLDIAFH